MSHPRHCFGGLVVAIAMLFPAASFGQRGPGSTVGDDIYGMPIIATGDLPENAHGLTRQQGRRIAGDALRNYLAASAAQEGRTVTHLRPAVFSEQSFRYVAFCGIAVLAGQADPNQRETRQYNTMVWYLRGHRYAVALGTKSCLEHIVKVKSTRAASSRRVVRAVVKKHLKALYGKVKSVRVGHVTNKRARPGKRVTATVSWTFIHPDGYLQSMKEKTKFHVLDVRGNRYSVDVIRK